MIQRKIASAVRQKTLDALARKMFIVACCWTFASRVFRFSDCRGRGVKEIVVGRTQKTSDDAREAKASERWLARKLDLLHSPRRERK